MEKGIPQHFIDDLVARIDIVDLIDTRVPLKKSGKNYSACCPFHEERTPSFTVSPDKQFYHCFGCGAHGTAIGFLMEHDRLGFVEAIEDLAQSAGLEVPKPTQNKQVIAIQESLSDLLEHAGEFYQQQLRDHPQAQIAVNYLKQRGLSGHTAKVFGIGFAPSGWNNLLGHFNGEHTQRLIQAGLAVSNDKGNTYDRFRNRIMFPIRNRRGKIIGFGGRVLENDTTAKDNADKKDPKYLNSPETPLFHKGKELYGLYECRQHRTNPKRLVVVEGYMDVVSLSQHGIHYAVATLGTAATEEHIEKLFRANSDIIFCFDGDKAGRQAAWRALENSLPALRGQRRARFLFLPDGEDPDSLVKQQGQAAFEALIEQATPLSDYFLSALGDGIDLSNVDGRAQLIEKARPLLQRINSDIYRELLSEQLAKTTHTDQRRIIKAPPPAPKHTHHTPFKLAVERSNVRWSIALLLAYPHLATQTDSAALAGIDLPGIDLLSELIDYLQNTPNANCGSVLEHFRDSEYIAHLAKLAQWKTDNDAPEQEFSDVIRRLTAQSNEQRLTALLNKAQTSALSDEEKQTLKNLTQRR